MTTQIDQTQHDQFAISHDPSFYSSHLFGGPEPIAMWNANVHNPFGFDQRDTMDFPEYQAYDDYSSASGNYQTSEASGSQYDSFPSYTQTSVSTDYAMPATRRPSRNFISQYSAPAVPLSRRRQSAQSIAASSIQRPSSAFTDSNFFAMSPNSAVGHHFPEQDHYETNDFVNFNTGVDNSNAGSPLAGSDEDNSGSSQIDSLGDAAPRSHPLYMVLPSDDGYYHCPFVATNNCGHEPKQLKCEYDKHIDSHLKPFKCKIANCSDQRFSSTACLLRHEREAHNMHNHAESLCEYPPCSRSHPGHGFPRSYNCKDHMARCHGWVETGPSTEKKRRSMLSSGSGKNGVLKQKTKAPSKKQRIAKLRQDWGENKALIENLSRNLAPDGPLMNMQITQIQQATQMLASISAELQKLTSKGMAG